MRVSKETSDVLVGMLFSIIIGAAAGCVMLLLTDRPFLSIIVGVGWTAITRKDFNEWVHRPYKPFAKR